VGVVAGFISRKEDREKGPGQNETDLKVTLQIIRLKKYKKEAHTL